MLAFHAQDVNVIDGVWAHLRKTLHASAPLGIEKRKDFIKSLHGAVHPLNTSGKDMLVDMCNGFQTNFGWKHKDAQKTCSHCSYA